MKFITFVISLLLLINIINSLLPDETKSTECEGGPYPNTISNFLLTPDPLVIGQSASYTFNGTRNVEILEGSIIDFLLFDENNEIVFKKMENLCSIEKCPLPIGNYEFTYGLYLNLLDEHEHSENDDEPPKTFLLYLTSNIFFFLFY